MAGQAATKNTSRNGVFFVIIVDMIQGPPQTPPTPEQGPKFKVLDNTQLTQELGQSLIDKPTFEVRSLVLKKFGIKLAGGRTCRYLMDNPQKAPQELRGGGLYVFLKDEIDKYDGISGLYYDIVEERFHKHQIRPNELWDKKCKVVLVEQ